MFPKMDLFSIGGLTLGGNSFQPVSSVEVFSQVENKWRLYKETDFVCKTWSWKT